MQYRWLLTPDTYVEAYLSAHYGLLREDTLRPIRDAVVNLRAEPDGDEAFFGGEFAIYNKVRIRPETHLSHGQSLKIFQRSTSAQ